MKLPIAVLVAASMIFANGCAQRTAETRVPTGPVVTTTAQPGVIPEGTTLAIRTNESISAETATAGGNYDATIVRDVIDQQGQVLIPSGSPAELTVVEVREPGVVGTSGLELALRSITVGGNTYMVTTPTVTEEGREGLGTNRRTAAMVGGGALLGTLIGAAAGGGSGAAIGAAVGAAGGAATQVLTRGDEVNVPAETLLTFRLDQPVRLEGYRR